jgi:hypothetical protein
MPLTPTDTQKSASSRFPYAQVTAVFFAFALMVFLNYLFTGNIQREHLRRETENMFISIESRIGDDLRELEVMLAVVSETSRAMLMDGVGYWMLFDRHLSALYHPDDNLLGMSLGEIEADVAGFIAELEREAHISTRRITDQTGEAKIITIRRLDNGWYLGVDAVGQLSRKPGRNTVVSDFSGTAYGRYSEYYFDTHHSRNEKNRRIYASYVRFYADELHALEQRKASRKFKQRIAEAVRGQGQRRVRKKIYSVVAGVSAGRRKKRRSVERNDEESI